MVENHNHCVLQWAGHAGYVTERFSGLLARQALVDVTLICEEQKLRVHKLVLASNSVYFEEILQQDLGQEPVIFLRDLNFEILKAMVEFMYCGETTVSQKNLPSLLAASKVFKVKQLVCIINTIMENGNCAEVSNKEVKVQENDASARTIDSLNENNTSLPESSNNNVIFVENNSLKDKQLEHSLYEDSYENENNSIAFLSALNVGEKDRNNLCAASAQERLKNDIKSNNLQLSGYCNELDLNTSDISSVPSTEQILSETNKDSTEDTVQLSDRLEKYVKVYTHKKRKTMNDIRNKLNRLSELIPISSSNDCIDLSDEPSNHVPVTLLTSLDMECAEYILSLDNENMRSVAEGLINEQLSLIRQKELNLIPNNTKKHNNIESNVEKKPVLRRSVRLNQQENEELTTVSDLSTQTTTAEKQLEKSNCLRKKLDSIKRKRKIKESNRKVGDQNAINAMKFSNKRCFSNLHAHKNNTTKLIVKRNIKSACKGKEDQKPRATNNKLKCKVNENANALKISVPPPPNLNSSIGYINRALWGDMSDIIEHNDDVLEFTDYSPNGEIPFAVGLLPLRAALEKMQATPDYQPRKTRSSVAPVKQETNNLKRKHLSESSVFAKRQNTNNIDQNDKTNAVCHIQIRAAPPQFIRNRKKFLPGHVPTLGSAAIINKR